jgi:hypothetical protein
MEETTITFFVMKEVWKYNNNISILVSIAVASLNTQTKLGTDANVS